MSRSAGNLPSLIFKSSVKGDIGQFSLDGRMLKVLMALDGKKDLGRVAGELRMELGLLKKIIQLLYRKKLIRKIEETVRVIDGDFFDFLNAQLSRAVGPIAEILIEDEIAEFSPNPNAVPCSRSAELVEVLARQIPREEKKVEFQKAMIEIIRSKGY